MSRPAEAGHYLLFGRRCRRVGRSTTASGPSAPAAAATTCSRLLRAAPLAFDPLGEVGRDRGVFGTLGTEPLQYRVVALVAVVREQRAAVERRQRERRRELTRVGDRIVDRDLILDDVGRDALQLLDDPHLVAVTQTVAVRTDAGPVGEVGRFHDERVAVPAGA